jgi:predicted anti-sigma-YlaC factor YlaD
MTILFAAAARRVFADGATIAHSSQEGHMIGMRLVLAIALTFAAIASADADKKKEHDRSRKPVIWRHKPHLQFRKRQVKADYAIA